MMAGNKKRESGRSAEASKPKSPTQFQNPSILSPLIDGLCVGGLSILVIIGFLIYVICNPKIVPQLRSEYRIGPEEIGPAIVYVNSTIDTAVGLSTISLPVIASRIDKVDKIPFANPAGIDKFLLMIWLTALINNPHFMASYRLLYRSREQVLRYRWASIYMPAILVAASILVLLGNSEEAGAATGAIMSLDLIWRSMTVGIFHLLGATASLYLAWHYNGQAWGMTASFLHIAGIRATQFERRCIRSAYWALTGFHVIWSLSLFLPDYESLSQLKAAVFVLALLMIPVGIHGFLRIQRRTGKRIPWRAMLPWIAIYFWYSLVFFHDYAIIFLQLSHALQYLGFTTRVEMNLAVKRNSRSRSSFFGVSASVVLVYLLFFVTGWLVFDLARFIPMTPPQQTTLHMALGLLGIIVNIHHYFVDGAIWKISNPAVRKDLFAHLRPV